jgi:NhaP-type Na+/H+ and K+/H+ antiporter
MRKVFGDFMLDGVALAADAAGFYGVDLPDAEGRTLGDWVQHQLGKPAVEGDEVTVGQLMFVVREMNGSEITRVGIRQALPGV